MSLRLSIANSVARCDMRVIVTVMTRILFQAGEAAALVGITANQLREWTGRRAIVSPDVPGRGRGKHALFSPTTVLVLRIVAELQTRFLMEVGALGAMASRLGAELADVPFMALYGRAVSMTGCDEYEIIGLPRARIVASAVIIPFDPHLVAIAESCGSRDQPAQFQLFPAVNA